jgi:hypothetical protein
LSNSLFVALHYYLGMAAGKSLRFAEFDVRLSEASTIEQRLAVFGEILELGGPVSKQVLFGALEDPTYGRNLLVSRRSPASQLLVVTSSRRGDSRAGHTDALERGVDEDRRPEFDQMGEDRLFHCGRNDPWFESHSLRHPRK